MAYTSGFTAVSGATFTAAQYNTNVRDNFSAIWVGTTAGDMDYYTSATAKSRLAAVSGGVLYHNGTAPAWLAKTTGGILHHNGTAPTWLSPSTAYSFLRATGTDTEMGSLIWRRKGGSATNWQDSGTTTYTPTKTLIQAGIVSVSYNPYGSTVVTYPIAYTYRPLIFVTVNAGYMTPGYADDSTTEFKATAYHTLGYSGSVNVAWMAIGE